MHQQQSISVFCLTPSKKQDIHSKVEKLTHAIQSGGAKIKSLNNESELFNQVNKSALILISMPLSTTIATISDPTFAALASAIQIVRRENTDIPIFLMLDKPLTLPSFLLNDLNGVLVEQDGGHEYLADNILKEAQNYLERTTPPFFKALIQYAQASPASWHCPGHSGGAAFSRHPTGQLFHDFFGENMLRADVCNAVESLGQLLDHTGPVADSEQKAARVFQADNLYFVTNGTSSSNKIVWHSHISQGDIVIIDRNCHKSIIHAVIMTGAIPIFLNPVRNGLGIIGPIPKAEFSLNNIRMKLLNNPLVKDKNQQPKLICITQCTYDGVLYNAEHIKQQLDGQISVLHFDEAWSPHTSFHPLYKKFHALDQSTRCDSSLVFATQSTHKLLAGLSQASQILVQNANRQTLDHHRFNEAYLMHTSTSPHYPIIASCDVTASMMSQPNGGKQIDEIITEAIEFRRAMEALKQHYLGDWWFSLWGPITTDNSSPEVWKLTPHADWHGFKITDETFNMLDPLKVTVMTPGLNLDGSFNRLGIPASIAAKFLTENGAIVEKVGLYSFLLLFTLGVTNSRWQTLISILQKLKKAFDENKPLTEIMPNFVAKHPQYKAWGLNTLCQHVHNTYQEKDLALLTQDIYSADITPAMSPTKAYAQLTNGNIERVPLDDLEDRITTMLVTPYPPGIPLLIPGERFNKATVEYLKMTRYFNECLPGFETHTQGLVQIKKNGITEYFVDCVIEKPSSSGDSYFSS